ncbi:MAG: LysR family transcriptional regulator [Tabrizicola sp.]|jgi:DNA-binding transcriptional LysR family regulator|nr:LysR family transcriptional regulator [Tabrizicola sp.]
MAAQNIPTDLLRSFISAVDLGSFTRAGHQVGRTQSAISLQIRRLEEVVDVKLFQRDAHRLQLTPEGKSLAQYARRILALNDEALASLRQPSVTGRIRLGAPHEYTASLLPEFLGKFARSHPNVMLEVTSDLSKSLIKRQANGELDLVVALHTEKDPVDGMLLYTEPLVWITGQDQERHLDPILPLVVAPPPCIYRDRILHTLNDLTRSCRIAYLSSSYNGIIAAVRAGMGVTVMTESTIPPGIRHLSERDGLPPLGQLSLRLHRAAGKPSDAIRALETYIAGSFSAPEVTWSARQSNRSRLSE